jgi:hypothetical protein
VIRIPQAGGAASAAPQAPDSGVASLMNELTEKDIRRHGPAQPIPKEEQGPTQDEILSRYVPTMPKTTRRARRSNQQQPVGGIVLGILEIFPALFFLGLGLVSLIRAVIRLFTVSWGDVVFNEKLLFALALIIFSIIYLLGVGAVFARSAYSLFVGRPFGWWFTMCLVVTGPLYVLACLALLIVAAIVGTITSDLDMMRAHIIGALAIYIIVVWVPVLAVSGGLLFYLLQQDVMDYYEIEMGRVASVFSAAGVVVACALAHAGVMIGIAYMGKEILS